MTNLATTILRRLALLLAAGLIIVCFSFLQSQIHAAGSLPQVELNAENVGPRAIEELTSKTITRDYANAWKSMAEALDKNRADLLDGYFTGFAKDRLVQLIAQQKQTGVHVRYDDRGHKLDALFYSPSGDAMQLRDRAQLGIEVLDGGKVIHNEQANMQYLVLMTPGADRWLVRDFVSTPEVKP
jgi:hypothetical protein